MTTVRRGTAALALVLVLAGCGSAPAAVSAAGPLPAVTDADCGWLAEAAPDGGPSLAVVVDDTASRPVGGWPAVALDAVAETARAGSVVTIVGVEGEGGGPVPVWVRQAVMLADARGTPREATIVALAQACAQRAGSRAVPARPGSDIVTAINTAVDTLGPARQGSRLVVITDGYASAGPLRIDRGVDIGDTPPAQVAAAVVGAPSLVDLIGLDVTIAGVGDLDGVSVGEGTRRWLEQLYRELCTQGGATRCTVLRDGGPPLPGLSAGAVAARPDDPVLLPPVEAPVFPGPEPGPTRLPASEFFEPGSASLRPGSEATLAETAARLAPDGLRAELVGHVATWGSVAYREDLSSRRAEAIRDALVRLGADPATLTARGGGSRERLVDDLDENGVLRPDRAALNRRVDIHPSPR